MRVKSVGVGVCVVGPAALAMLSGCVALAPRTSHEPAAATHSCATRQFAAVRLQDEVRSSIVRVESDLGTGTGFVVRHTGEEILIATNYHVVTGGEKFDVIFDGGARLADL